MKLFIQPFDVLFFRDNKPFPMGEAHLAKSVFPPGPSVFQGAIRSRIISDKCGFDKYNEQVKNCSGLFKAIGGPDKSGKQSYGKLRIKGPLIAKRDGGEIKEYFPRPLDINLSPVEKKLSRITFSSAGGSQDFIPLKTKKCEDEDEKKNGIDKIDFIEKEVLIRYLKRDDNNLSGLENKEIFSTESRVGIQLGDTGTTKEGMFYTAGYIRLEKGFGFILYVSGVDDLLKESGMLALGGKRRAAFFEKKEDETIIIDGNEIEESLSECNGFKIYLATPAMFKKGWKPDIGDEFELVTADIGKALYIGGFDVLNNRPKTLRRAVPAGSVYYFKPKNGQTMENIANKVIDMFHEKCISDYDSEIGFGLCFVGGWKYV